MNASNLTAPLSPDELATITALYEDGQYLTAYAATQSHGEFKDWQGAESRVMAGRLAYHLGGFRTSRLLMHLAWRQAPENPEVAYYYAYNVLQKRGPWGAWQFISKYGELDSPTDDTRSSWYALTGQVAGLMRDFETAEKWLQKALEVWPESPWIRTVQSHLLETEDRYDEALDKSEEALSIRPWYRPAIQTKATLLTVMGRDQDSIVLLNESLTHIESAALAQQLTAVYLELRDYDGAAASLEKVRELAPLFDKQSQKWFAACEADIHYFNGRMDEAVAAAKEAGEGFFATMAERLSDPERRKAGHKALNIPFVRQHQLTCVPATLTAIAHYWDRPVDHLEVADQICYAGTSALNERRWANENGWATKEFTVTEASVKDLIDADIPCTLTTTQPGNAHMQAIEGYDARRGTFLIVDPYVRVAEGIADKLLEDQASSGPRGMAMVPNDQKERLDAIDLPDSAEWNLLHELDAALDGHDREKAIRIIAKLQAESPEHRIGLEAQRHLAVYDANTEQLARTVEAMREKYPDDDVLNLQWLSVMHNQQRREDRLDFYRKLNERPDCHPLLRREYATELSMDSSQLPHALFLLKRILRQMPTDGRTFHSYASALWDLGKEHRETALELFRFAACLEERDEVLSEAYLIAAHHFRQTDQAVDFLRKRFARHGDKSGWPAQTLSDAYRRLCREGEAIDVLEEAVALRPDDGDLALYAMEAFASAGTQYIPRAEQLLEQARGKSSQTRWLRADAFLASVNGELSRALDAWKTIVVNQPLSTDAHSAIARLLAETQDINTALAWLDEAAARFPHHIPLQELRISWLREEAPELAEPAIRSTLERMPDNAWLIRELAFLLVEKGEDSEAEELAQRAFQTENQTPTHHHLQAAILARRGDLLGARREYRLAIELGVDNIHALTELMECCETPSDRREELDFIQEQLMTQVVFGDAIVTFRSIARETLQADEVLEVLRNANRERPDLWQTWSAVVQQLGDMNLLAEAAVAAEESTNRYPLIPRLWLDRGLVYRAQGDFEGELNALEKAWEISPYWYPVVDALCEVHERNRDFEKARGLLEQITQSDPLQSRHHSRLAEFLWDSDDREAALERAETAIQIAPGNLDAWRMLQHFCMLLERPERPADLARELTKKRPNEPRSWLTLVRALDGPESAQEAHRAIDRALELNERSEDAHMLRAHLFAEEGDVERAAAACRPASFGDSPPFGLKLAEARIETQFNGIERGIDLLRDALQHESEFYGGWMQLGDWLRELDDREEYLKCTEQMVRLEPHDPISMGYLGEAYIGNERTDEAIEIFKRAFDLTPSYEFAGIWLFDLYLDPKKDVEKATDVLERLEQHADPSPLIQSRVVQLAAVRDNRDEAQQAFADLCVMDGELQWGLRNALSAFHDASWGPVGTRWLGEALTHPDVNEEVASAWGTLSVSDGIDIEGQLIERLSGRLDRPELFELAADDYMGELIENGFEPKALDFIERHRETLFGSNRTWAQVGYVYATLYRYTDAVDWLADWQSRTELLPWHLFNFVESARALGLDDAAREAGEFALQLPQPDGTSPMHMIWLALEDPMGNVELRRECVDHVDPEEIHPGLKFLRQLLVAIDQMLEQSAPFASVKTQVQEAIEEYREALPKEPGHRRFLRQSIVRIAKHYGGLRPKLWGLSRWKYR
jgi:cellulose synthase operon protein C